MEYKQERRRLQSYKLWPHSIWNKTLTPLALAAAGFYFTGKTDRTRCFECGIELYHWEDGNNPRLMHQRINPCCRFIRNAPCGNVPLEADPMLIPLRLRGASANSYREICNVNRKIHEILTRDSRNLIQVRMTETAPLAGPQFQKVPTPTYANSMIAEEALLSHNGSPNASSASGSSRASGITGTIRESALLCKVCFEEDLQVVFLPCGHIVTCKKCAIKLKNCCFCRMTVKGRKQIFIP